MSDLIRSVRINIASIGGSELKAVSSNESLQELFKQKQALMSEMNAAKRKAAKRPAAKKGGAKKRAGAKKAGGTAKRRSTRSKARKGKKITWDCKTTTTAANEKRSKTMTGIAKPKITCPHCGKEGGVPQMNQWHFDNCKTRGF